MHSPLEAHLSALPSIDRDRMDIKNSHKRCGKEIPNQMTTWIPQVVYHGINQSLVLLTILPTAKTLMRINDIGSDQQRSVLPAWRGPDINHQIGRGNGQR